MEVDERIAESALELRARLEEHCTLLCSALGTELESCVPCGRIARFKCEIVHVVEVLEGTRRAFKSRQLEILRKRLIRVLAESD